MQSPEQMKNNREKAVQLSAMREKARSLGYDKEADKFYLEKNFSGLKELISKHEKTPVQFDKPVSMSVTVGLKILEPIMGNIQLKLLKEGLRGEEKEYFQGVIKTLAQAFLDMPKIYGQDGKGDAAVAYLHFFSGGSDWYILEKDTDVSQSMAFGLTSLNGYDPELGYINLNELKTMNVEIDFQWEPKTLKEIKAKQVVENSPEA